MKKMISIFLSMAVILTSVALIDFSASAQTDGFGYITNSDNTAEIWNYSGTQTDVVIPSEIDGYTVTKIGYPAFGGNSNIKSVFIPDTVIDIRAEAFECCTSLESINVSSNNPYYSSLDGVLMNKENSTLLQYPIGRKDMSYIIPNSVVIVNEQAFCYSTILKNIFIPSSVLYLNNPFYRCSGLENIEVDASNENYTSLEGVLFNKNCTQLLQYPISALRTSYDIPNSVTDISYRAFYTCKELQSITIPKSVTYIAYEAFAHCYGLKNLVVPSSVESIETQAFMSCSGLTSAVIENGVKQIYSGAFSNCFRLTTMVIPESVTYIGTLTFSNCSALRCVTVLNRDCAFPVCKNAIPANSAIRGYENSTAQTYASTYGRDFTAVDKYKPDSLGGSIRIGDAGLRFGFSFNKNLCENVEEYGLIYSYSETQDLTIETNGAKYLTAVNRKDDGDCVTFNLVFTDIPESAYNQVVSARAYVKVYGKYYYSDILCHSFRSVAQAVLADSSISQDVKDSLNNLLG